jgi:hypothetical protein
VRELISLLTEAAVNLPYGLRCPLSWRAESTPTVHRQSRGGLWVTVGLDGKITGDRSRRAGPAATSPVRGRPASTAGATAVPWLGCGELLALGSGSR